MEEKISAVRQQKQAEAKANELRQAEEKERWVNNTKMIFAKSSGLSFSYLADLLIRLFSRLIYVCLLWYLFFFFLIYVLFYQLVICCCWLKFTTTIVATAANPDKII